MLRDVQQGAFLNKNKKFENTDFDKVRQNTDKMKTFKNIFKIETRNEEMINDDSNTTNTIT